jgi:hypothetical protein
MRVTARSCAAVRMRLVQGIDAAPTGAFVPAHLMRLYALTDLISKADNEAKLTEAERRIDDILKGELEKHAKGEAEAAETAALGLATHRLEHLIAQRRVTLDGKQTSALQA